MVRKLKARDIERLENTSFAGASVHPDAPAFVTGGCITGTETTDPILPPEPDTSCCECPTARCDAVVGRLDARAAPTEDAR